MGVRSQVHHPWLGVALFNHQGVGNAIRFVESLNPECVGKLSCGLENLRSSNGVGGHIVIAYQNNSVWIPDAHLESFQRWPDPPWPTGVVHHRQVNVYPEDLVWLDPVPMGSASNDLLRHCHTHFRQPSADRFRLLAATNSPNYGLQYHCNEYPKYSRRSTIRSWGCTPAPPGCSSSQKRSRPGRRSSAGYPYCCSSSIGARSLTARRKPRVRAFCGAPSTCAAGPSSTTTPLSMKSTRSETSAAKFIS